MSWIVWVGIIIGVLILIIIIIKISTRNNHSNYKSGNLMDRARSRGKSLLDCCIKKLRGGA